MLEIRDVSKIYRTRGGLFSKPQEVHALRNVSLGLARGTTYGLVGESGSGKTTLTRCILRLEAPTSGAILFEGEDMGALSPAAMRRLRARVQIVFQDPYASLNPRMSIHDIIAEPMVIHRDVVGLDRRARADRVVELLTLVGLGPQHLHRYPHEFSGGQRQRIGVARALATNPALVLLDEPTSALDVSVQAQVLNLLHDLQARLGLTYFFISHDLGVIRCMSDRIGVIRHGVLVEEGPTDAVFEAPSSPYTRALISAIPDLDIAPPRLAAAPV